MSRIGKKPVNIPEGVKAEFKSGVLTVSGSKGSLSLNLHPKVSLQIAEREINVNVQLTDNKKQRALWGLFRAMISNMVEGVSKGFEKKLEVNGVGFKQQISKVSQALELYKKQLSGNDMGKIAEAIYAVRTLSSMQGEVLEMRLGFSHPIFLQIPKELAVTVDKNIISINGFDKQKVGQFAAEIRELKKPEPYKGKGIKYIDEIVRRKAGKVVKVVGGGK